MNYALEILRQTRQNYLSILETLTTEQLLTIPAGFKNNILWNLGHTIVVQNLLTYGRADLAIPLEVELIEKYRKGSHPTKHAADSEVEAIKALLTSSVNQLESDLAAGIFKSFNTYPTSYGLTLNSIEDAINFNNAHEALHLGYVMAMRKLV
jgi:hypothetical protein